MLILFVFQLFDKIKHLWENNFINMSKFHKIFQKFNKKCKI